ncbi:UspA domain-containing protein [Alcanivorax hongdengensis A-11-3]|uniref:UspA domain-containing protein n=1 Tax=Alcanivorax hongdengensis A-11-3 TaxID=1177179 RepID=L0WG49_9GAMM|nr:universal stress protein [Alcanivorax hongdengensis]EKF74800.1 UspA domain-containing protein [Alcanivorax hongdengensis A-11-3]
MYSCIILAFDGSEEGRAALKEGKELARLCGARVHLLSVLDTVEANGLGDGIYAVERFRDSDMDSLRELVDDGLQRLRNAGLEQPVGHIAFGEPVEHIAALARQVEADLIVVGHRHQGMLARWWQGSLSRALLDQVDCSILVAMKGFSAAC